MSFKVYFDFNCPYVYHFRKWVDVADLGYDIEWRCFLQAQAQESRPGYRLFDHAEEHPPGLDALCAYRELRGIDDKVADAFHRLLLESRYEAGIDLADRDALLRAAGAAHADADALRSVLESGRQVREVAAEHDDAVVAHGIFGTPTLVSHEGDTLYVRLGAPPGDEASARRVMRNVVDIALAEPGIRELKRT